MDELTALSLEIKNLKKNGQKQIPIDLKKKVLQKIESGIFSVEEAAIAFKMHKMTFYKWRRKYNKDVFHCDLVQLPTETVIREQKKELKVFIEISLGNGCLMRIYQ